MTLGEFLDQYTRGRTDLKASTRTVHQHTVRNLLECFGAAKPLRSFIPVDGDRFRSHLLAEVAENTARRRRGQAAAFFKAAARSGFFPKAAENPFAHLPSNVVENHARMRFVEREDIDRVIAALPDADWRCMIALARYGGLRCPSEPQALRKSDIDWTLKRIRVTVPKLSHLPNKATRVIPLFPELVEPLREAIAASPNEYVIGNYRDHSNNFGTEFTRFVKAAGVEPWPKPFVNLRSSRETELAEVYPIHVVCQWIGNSPDVAVRHYLQLRPHHFDQATGEAARNPSRQAAAGLGTAPRGVQSVAPDSSDLPRILDKTNDSRMNSWSINGPSLIRTDDLLFVRQTL